MSVAWHNFRYITRTLIVLYISFRIHSTFPPSCLHTILSTRRSARWKKGPVTPTKLPEASDEPKPLPIALSCMFHVLELLKNLGMINNR